MGEIAAAKVEVVAFAAAVAVETDTGGNRLPVVELELRNVHVSVASQADIRLEVDPFLSAFVGPSREGEPNRRKVVELTNIGQVVDHSLSYLREEVYYQFH